MNPRVLKRFIILMAILVVAAVAFQMIVDEFVSRPPGDFHTKRGDQLLSAKDFEAALEHFNLALEEQPDHRGALMGRALVFFQTDRLDEAAAELDYLIEFLERTLEPSDDTGRGALAAAYANRGIIHDRRGEYQAALDAYIEALKVDEGAIEGPGVVHKILYGSERVSSVRDRACLSVMP